MYRKCKLPIHRILLFIFLSSQFWADLWVAVEVTKDVRLRATPPSSAWKVACASKTCFSSYLFLVLCRRHCYHSNAHIIEHPLSEIEGAPTPVAAPAFRDELTKKFCRSCRHPP